MAYAVARGSQIYFPHLFWFLAQTVLGPVTSSFATFLDLMFGLQLAWVGRGVPSVAKNGFEPQEFKYVS